MPRRKGKSQEPPAPLHRAISPLSTVAVKYFIESPLIFLSGLQPASQSSTGSLDSKPTSRSDLFSRGGPARMLAMVSNAQKVSILKQMALHRLIHTTKSLIEAPKPGRILKTPERPSRNPRGSRKTSTKLPKRISAQLKKANTPVCTSVQETLSKLLKPSTLLTAFTRTVHGTKL